MILGVGVDAEFLFSYPVTLQALDVVFHNLGNIPFLTTDSFMLLGTLCLLSTKIYISSHVKICGYGEGQPTC
jgi:hypothetical protein